MKRTIRLKEAELKRMISESVRRVLNEVSTNTAISAHKKAQSDIDDYEWGDDNDYDKYHKRQRQADKFADYAQNKGAGYYPYGVIGWSQDESDGVFDRSGVVLGDSIDDVPDYPYGIYALTREGRKIYEEWREDASCGYDLCYGRMKGLAAEIGGGEWDIWNYLTNDKSLSKQIS